MSTIYVITCGTYSNYSILGVCTDKAKAEEIVKCYNYNRTYSFGAARIEEYEDGTCDVSKHVYKVYFQHDKPLPSISSIIELFGENKIDYLTGLLEMNIIRPYFAFIGATDYSYMVVITADDEAAAQKIAYDLMAEYIANEENIT